MESEHKLMKVWRLIAHTYINSPTLWKTLYQIFWTPQHSNYTHSVTHTLHIYLPVYTHTHTLPHSAKHYIKHTGHHRPATTRTAFHTPYTPTCPYTHTHTHTHTHTAHTA